MARRRPPFAGRLAPAGALAALACAAAPAPATATGHVPLEARVAACAGGPERADRRATFTASMPDRPGADALAMRFVLQRATPTGWRRVQAPTFGRWERSAAGAPGFVFAKRVAGLWSPARFRAVVRFAWLDGAGRVLARATRRTGACRQPDRRPDLRVVSVAIEGHEEGAAHYVVRVVNEGRGTLEDRVVVALGTAAGSLGSGLTSDPIASGEVADVRLRGPACTPGEGLRAVVDAARDVRERDERDNALSAPCPG